MCSCTITFSKRSEIILWVVGIKYERKVYFPSFTMFGKLKQKGPIKVLEGSTSSKYKTNFETLKGNMSRGTLSILTSLS